MTMKGETSDREDAVGGGREVEIMTPLLTASAAAVTLPRTGRFFGLRR